MPANITWIDAFRQLARISLPCYCASQLTDSKDTLVVLLAIVFLHILRVMCLLSAIPDIVTATSAQQACIMYRNPIVSIRYVQMSFARCISFLKLRRPKTASIRALM